MDKWNGLTRELVEQMSDTYVAACSQAWSAAATEYPDEDELRADIEARERAFMAGEITKEQFLDYDGFVMSSLPRRR